MSQWVRLWEDMPTDPKWRVVARRAGRPLPEVLAVFVFMLTNASQAQERGVLANWSDEDVGAAIDVDGEHVAAIRNAMQGKTLDGDKLTGWDRRQPKREDGASERAKEWRKNNRTQPNATERTETPREDTDTEKKEKKEDSPKRVRTSYPDDFEKLWEACSAWRGHSGKMEAADEWRRLSSEDRLAAIAGVPGYSASLRVPNAPTPLHVCRFLKKRRFEIYAANVLPFATGADPPKLSAEEQLRRAQDFDRRWKAGEFQQ